MKRAAGISAAVLACHPETWAELARIAYSNKPISGAVKDPVDGALAEVTLSGVHLVRLLDMTHDRTGFRGVLGFDSPETRALAGRTYQAIAAVVDTVEPGSNEPVPPILLDDRPASR
jgi:hypothetical protein